MLDKELLDMLICPKCKGSIKLSRDSEYIICDNCHLAYKLDNNMPIMLIDNAVDSKSVEKE